MIRTLIALSVIAVLGCAVAAEKPAKNGVADAIAFDKADKIEVKAGKWNEPNLVTGEDDLKKLIPDEATRKRLMKEVDFKTHVLLVFVWEGSVGDKLEFAILESFPEQVKFSLLPSGQRRNRIHIELFAVKKESRWSAK